MADWFGTDTSPLLVRSRICPLRFPEDQARVSIVPDDLGAVGIERLAITERGANGEVAPFDPRHALPRVKAEIGRRDAVRSGGNSSFGVGTGLGMAQRYAERLFQPDRGGERERPASDSAFSSVEMLSLA